MNKVLKCGIIVFLIFFIVAIIVYCSSSMNENNSLDQVEGENDKAAIIVDVDNAIEKGKWYDITEEDKITLALGTETDIIAKTIKYLKENKIAIFFVYGGPFDSELKGNYIICTGFNEEGRAKILYPDDNFEKEWRYAFEGVVEFAQKVMLLEM